MDSVTTLDIIVREWPKGHRLLTLGDYHLSFDPPVGGKKTPAVMIRIYPEKQKVHVLRIKTFTNDAEALAWFREEVAKR